MTLPLAVKRWLMDKDEYPEQLEVLVQEGYLNKLPRDLYSDKSLIYKNLEDGFILYSVGPNFTDEGGTPGHNRGKERRQWAGDGDTILWPVHKKAF